MDGWREAISYLGSHPEEAMKMGRRARAIVEEGLNLESYIRDMVEIVKSVVAEEESAPAIPERLVEK